MRKSAFCFVLLLAACAPSPGPRGFRGPPPGEGFAPRARLFVSPAGEPFRPAEGAAAPGGTMAAWFAGADADHDGTLNFAEFQADFRRWFAALDTNHDGEIAPDEVTRYETEILPEMASFRPGGGRRPGMGGMSGRGGPPGGMGRGGGRRMGGGMGMGGGAFAGGAARFGLLPIPHPVMAADQDLNRGVSTMEFDRAATSRFNLLDEAHDGRLTLAELQALRMRQFGEGRGGRRGRGGERPPPEEEP